MPETGKIVVLGKIAGTHGIRGELKLHTYSGEISTFAALDSLMLRTPAGVTESFAIQSLRMHGKKILVSLKGYDSINKVEHLVGREVCLLRSDFPRLEEGEYYWCDLIGLSVQTVDGQQLGTLEEIYATGSNDVYAVRQGRREYLIPALDDVVVDLDMENRIMKIAPYEGLFDL